MVDYGTDFYCKLSQYQKQRLLWNGRATWEATGMRVPGGIRRGKLVRGRRPHPAYYRGRRVHVAYYRQYIALRLTPYGKASTWQDRFGSMLPANVGQMSVRTFGGNLDPLGMWTWGGLYDYQVPYVRPMWTKWARKWEAEAANVNTAVQSQGRGCGGSVCG